MEQGYIPQRNMPQGIALGWTQQSVLPNEAVEAPSQSASSAVISPASRNNDDSALSENSGQSSSSLKERDYIGLAEVSSAPYSSEAEINSELNLAETDLRLGFGPALDAFDNCPEALPSSTSTSTPHKPEAAEVALHIKEDVSAPSSMPNTWQSGSTKSLVSANPLQHINGLQGTPPSSASKNGGKRMYAEAMANVSRDVRSFMKLNPPSGAINVCDPRSSTNQVVSTKQFQDIDKKAHPLHPQGVFWAPPPHGPSWQSQPNYRSVASQKGKVFSSAPGDKDGEVARNAKLDIAYRSDNIGVQSTAEENALDDAPPAKGQVVGWPPVRTYRRSTLATRIKPTRDEGDGQSAVYVKVNMEGIPIGRKVDLNAYKSYDSLLTALEDMFHNPNSGPGARFLKGSEFVLTYEDKEGDWMLVGDVPWGMFVNTVRRLRITRGSDMTGLGSRTSCHA